MLTLSRSCCKALGLGTGISQKCCYQLGATIRLSSRPTSKQSSNVATPEVSLHDDATRNSQPKASVNYPFFGSTPSAKTKAIKDFNDPNGDPDVFGTLSVTLKTADDEAEFDEGDIMEKQHLENVPDHSKKLSTKQYADMIKEHLRNKNLNGAIDVLKERMLKQDRVKPENYIYNLLIGACGRTGQAKQAFHLYNEMKRRSLKVTGGTYTALFNACATSFYPNDALKRANHLRQLMVEKKYQPNATNYHAMIKAYGRCGDLSTAFSLVDEMIEHKLLLTNDAVNFLMQACISDKDAGLRHALLVWRKMREHNINPSIYTYNLILRICRDCGLGDAQLANNILKNISSNSKQILMSTTGIPEHLKTDVDHSDDSKGNIGTFLLGLDGEHETQSLMKQESKTTESECDNFQDFQESIPRLVEGEIVAKSASALLPADSTECNWPNLLAIKARLGSLTSMDELTSGQDRLMLFGGCSEFLRQMEQDKVLPNIKTFTQLLDLIPPTRAAEKELMRAMTEYKVPRDVDFYNMLIKKRSLQQDYEGARDTLSLILQARLEPNIITYGVLAMSCKTEAQAKNLLNELDQAGFRVNAEILGALLKQACYNWNFGYVLEMMETAKREEIEINPQFYQHLDTFYKKGRQVMHDKECGHSVPKFMDTDYFNTGFKLFSARYKNWLRETKRRHQDLKRQSDIKNADCV